MEQVESAVKQWAFLTPEHLEMSLAPTRTLLEGLPSDIRSFTNNEVFLYATIHLFMIHQAELSAELVHMCLC